MMVIVLIFIWFSIKSLSRTIGIEIKNFGSREGIEFLYDAGHWLAMNDSTHHFIMFLPFLIVGGYIQARIRLAYES